MGLWVWRVSPQNNGNTCKDTGQIRAKLPEKVMIYTEEGTNNRMERAMHKTQQKRKYYDKI